MPLSSELTCIAVAVTGVLASDSCIWMVAAVATGTAVIAKAIAPAQISVAVRRGVIFIMVPCFSSTSGFSAAATRVRGCLFTKPRRHLAGFGQLNPLVALPTGTVTKGTRLLPGIVCPAMALVFYAPPNVYLAGCIQLSPTGVPVDSVRRDTYPTVPDSSGPIPR